jgi:enoyl-CoA hydratase/carnithine racemase
MSETLQISREGRVLRVALNRPDKRNALNVEMCAALAEVFDEAEKSPAVRVVLLSGNGKSFCAGMDLAEVLSQDASAVNTAHERIFAGGALVTKPLVAAVHGAALAGGTGLVANCHVVVASEDATFGLTEVRVGLWPFVIFRAVAGALGERRTVELALTGRIIGASEAREFGLVHQVVPAADLMASAEKLAAGLAEASPTAIAAGLVFVREARSKTPEEAGDLAHHLRNRVFRSDDFKEGIQAFHEKRPPQWPSLKPQDVGGSQT